MKTNLNQKRNQLKILTEFLLNDQIKNILKYFSFFLILFSGYIVDFIKDVNLAWKVNLFIYRLVFLILIFVFKKQFNTFAYKIIIALIINDFIDRSLGITTWSINDTLTIIYILTLTIKNKNYGLKN